MKRWMLPASALSRPRPHGQVVRVQSTRLAARSAQLVRRDALHRGGSAHGHEHGGVEIAVGGGVGERAGVPAGSVAPNRRVPKSFLLFKRRGRRRGCSQTSERPRCERLLRISFHDAAAISGWYRHRCASSSLILRSRSQDKAISGLRAPRHPDDAVELVMVV